MAEELAREGFHVCGIDPALESIETARTHAAQSGLAIRYETGFGDNLPLDDATFDSVACCDVLEHVDDLERVIAEAARVLKPGGVFLFDTIDPTLRRKIASIQVMQEWPSSAFVPPDVHVWERFIKPQELTALLALRGMIIREPRGISPRRNPLLNLLDMRRRGQVARRGGEALPCLSRPGHRRAGHRDHGRFRQTGRLRGRE